MQLTHLPTPPPAVSPKLEAILQRRQGMGPAGTIWFVTKAVGVYVPGEFPEAEVELLAVIDA